MYPEKCDQVVVWISRGEEFYLQNSTLWRGLSELLESKRVLYSGTSLIWSLAGLGKSDLNGEVTLLQGLTCTVEYNLGLIKGDANANGEVTLLVR